MNLKLQLLILCLASGLVLCGCDKQAKINSQKIDVLSEKMVHLEQIHAKQFAILQAQMAMLAPQLDKEASAYFEKNHDYALFFHTNTLFLLITIGKKIEAQLQAAESVQADQNFLAYKYHTNQISTTYLGAAQIEEEMTALAKRLEQKINAETWQSSAALSNALMNQIVISAMPSAPEVAWKQQMESQLIQIKRDLEAIKTRLANTNEPAAP